MPRRIRVAAPLALALLGACGDSQQTAPPPVVSCGTTADAGTLAVGAPPTCGTVTGLGTNTYSFTSGAAGTYSVTLWTTHGDADLYVYAQPGGALVGSSINVPPIWVDAVVFQAAASTLYTVAAEDANYYDFTGSTYAVQVTSP